MPIERNKYRNFLFVFTLCYERLVAFSAVWGEGSCQVAEISAKQFKRGCKIYHLDENKHRILSNFKIFLSQTPLKTYLLKVQAFFGFGRNCFLYLAWPGLATVDKKMILSKYLAVGAFSKTIQFKKIKK